MRLRSLKEQQKQKGRKEVKGNYEAFRYDQSKSGEKVTPQTLLEKQLISKIKGRLPLVKILGEGKLEKSLTIENCLVSQKAKEIIKKANGSIK